jgi:hypothetical protein
MALARVLGVLLLIGLIVVLLIVVGIINIDIDADVTGPDVQVEGGDLPDVEVEPAPEASAEG